MMMSMASVFPRKHAHSLRRLPSLAFDFGTFSYEKDQAPSSRDGLLKESPTTPCPKDYYNPCDVHRELKNTKSFRVLFGWDKAISHLYVFFSFSFFFPAAALSPRFPEYRMMRLSWRSATALRQVLAPHKGQVIRKYLKRSLIEE